MTRERVCDRNEYIGVDMHAACLDCLHCGATFPMSLPMSLSFVIDVCKAWTKAHVRCRFVRGKSKCPALHPKRGELRTWRRKRNERLPGRRSIALAAYYFGHFFRWCAQWGMDDGPDSIPIVGEMLPRNGKL